MLKLFASVLINLGYGGTQAAEFPPNVEINKKTIQALIDVGSDPGKPPPLEHHFYCDSSDSLNALLTKGKSFGYRVPNVGDNVHEGRHYWYGDLIKETVLYISIINKENSIFSMVKQYAGIDNQDLEITIFEAPMSNWDICGMPNDELALIYNATV